MKKKIRRIENTKVTTYSSGPIPRFEHTTLGIINPVQFHVGSTEIKKSEVKELDPDLTIAIKGSKYDIKPKTNPKKALPSHLETPYIYVQGTKLNQKAEPKKKAERPATAAPISTTARAKNGKKEASTHNWNVSTHTEYITKKNDFPQYHKSANVNQKLEKEEREKLFEENLKVQDYLFKIYDTVQRKHNPGAVDTDAKVEEQL